MAHVGADFLWYEKQKIINQKNFRTGFLYSNKNKKLSLGIDLEGLDHKADMGQHLT